ncbi:Ppx/GppA phosphatase family protein [Acetobacter thailandicus]|uniref:Ppx/GppA phosphatase family protein n=1 Tax=Acetobacter thailandicus TaxID=1502842 RepID=UPI001BA90D01|nr:Ppx/GppA phosphatase family protein [Acetobacter thailandicus]MBS0986967.1 Ppx/GppA family phosphatase [Acetobacter thailandicus]MBS1004640.1 Ppx/GppA family phosphatase [Acetobacter thailandicus]
MAYSAPWGAYRNKPPLVSFSYRSGGRFFAALDLGTNNCRLMVAAPQVAGGFRIMDSYNRMVRLGEGLHLTGRLTEQAMARTIDALKICAKRIEKWNLKALHAVATEACRRAENGPAFIERIKAETGFSVSVISGREEARLAVEGCASLFHQMPFRSAQSRALLFDIGGGSTEVAWVRIDSQTRSHELIGYISLPVGVITLAEQFCEHDGDITSCYEMMIAHVKKALHEFESVHRITSEIRREQVCLISAGGAVTTLASLVLNLPRYVRHAVDGIQLPSEAVRRAAGTLRQLGPERIKSHPCIGAERASVILPGCAIFEAIHDVWPVANVTVADRGLREGMMLRMIRAAKVGRGKFQSGAENEMKALDYSARAGLV